MDTSRSEFETQSVSFTALLSDQLKTIKRGTGGEALPETAQVLSSIGLSLIGVLEAGIIRIGSSLDEIRRSLERIERVIDKR